MASLVPPNAYNALMGLFRPQAAPAGASAYDQAMAQARSNALGQFGMGLVAAAIPQTAAQRVQSLQAALGSFQPSTTDIYNQAQARLMLQRTEAEQAAQKRMEEELKTITGGTPPAAPASAPVGEFRELPEAAKKLLTAAPVPTAPTYTPQEAEYLKANSYSPEAFAQAKAKIAELKLGKTGGVEYGKTPVEYTKPDGSIGIGFPYFDANGIPKIMPADITGGGVPITQQQKAEMKATGDAIAKDTSEYLSSSPSLKRQLQENLNVIDSMLTENGEMKPEIGNVVGSVQGKYDPRDPGIAGTVGSYFLQGSSAGSSIAKIDKLTAGAFAQGIDIFTGKGALSDAEGLVAKSIITSLQNRTQDDPAYAEELKNFKRINENAIKRMEIIDAELKNGKSIYDAKAEAMRQVPETIAQTDKPDPLGLRK
jgi:hypothetical protein